MTINRNTLIVIVLVSCFAITIYSVLKKGSAVPAVAIIVDGVSGKIIKQPSEQEEPPFWDNYPVFTMQAENHAMGKDLMVYDKDLQPVPIRNLLKNRNTLLFKYNLAEAEQAVIDSTLRYIKSLNYPNTILLVSAENSRYFKFKMQSEEGADNNIYFMEDPGFDLLIERKQLPFLFTCSNEFKMANVFVPRKEIPEVTQKYLQFMLQSFKTPNAAK